MNPRLIQIFGPQFVVDDVRDLELLTDLLSISRDHLNVMFAVASYLEQVPDGRKHMRPALRERIHNSLRQLQKVPAVQANSNVAASLTAEPVSNQEGAPRRR